MTSTLSVDLNLCRLPESLRAHGDMHTDCRLYWISMKARTDQEGEKGERKEGQGMVVCVRVCLQAWMSARATGNETHAHRWISCVHSHTDFAFTTEGCIIAADAVGRLSGSSAHSASTRADKSICQAEKSE